MNLNGLETNTPQEPVTDTSNGLARKFAQLKRLFLSNKLPVLITIVALFVLSAGALGLRIRANSQRNESVGTAISKPQETIKTAGAELSEQDSKTAPADKKPTTATSKKQPTTNGESQTALATAPVPAPVVANTTNCLPANPTQYQQYYKSITNSAYLQTNSYGDTTKMYAALQFAGLLDTINGKQVVVFAPNDYVFDTKLTAQQLAWMYQSPANMRSVLGWHVTTGCITYDGENPIKGKTGTTTVNTVNGSVTVTMSSPTKIDAAGVAIWDWFTSNGAVTFMTDFIKPPQVP